MKKVNCYRCEYVFHAAGEPAEDWSEESMSCGHPRYDGACPISGVTECPKKRRKHG